MICWIAGFPNSGSTLVRQLIQQVFEFPTWSQYVEEAPAELFDTRCETFARNWTPALYRQITVDKQTWFVKTHEAPIDDQPAIYVVRNGIDCHLALSKFWVMPVHPIIGGAYSHPFPNWSGMWRLWGQWRKGPLLLLRYEEILADWRPAATAISEFLGLERKGEFVNDPQAARERWHQIFRTSWWERADFDQETERLFWDLHEPVMIELGYGSEKGN